MESKRCPSCGLLNYSDASCCRRCGWMPSDAHGAQALPMPRTAPAPSNGAPNTPYGPPAAFGAPVEHKTETKAGAAIAGVFSAIAVLAITFVLPPQIRFLATIGSLFGLVTSLLPYFVARSRGHTKLGVIAIPVCTLCGAVLGLLLAIPVAVVFTLISIARPAVPAR